MPQDNIRALTPEDVSALRQAKTRSISAMMLGIAAHALLVLAWLVVAVLFLPAIALGIICATKAHQAKRTLDIQPPYAHAYGKRQNITALALGWAAIPLATLSTAAVAIAITLTT